MGNSWKMENKKVIGLYGVFGVGKSYLAHGLSSRFWDYDTVATDNLLAIARDLDKSDLYLQQSSYLAWQIIGDNSQKNIVEGFKRYRDKLQPFIRIILDRSYKQRVDMIFEGLHISHYVFQEYSHLLDINPLLVTITDKDLHWARVEEKCRDRPELLKRITPHFQTVRILQDFLTEEANSNSVPIIDNGFEKGKTLDAIVQKLRC